MTGFDGSVSLVAGLVGIIFLVFLTPDTSQARIYNRPRELDVASQGLLDEE